MCGIAGFTRFHHSTGDIDTLKAMGNAIRHRGPDAGGEYLDERVGLCHRRLAIIDLSAAGTQPMHSADNSLVIVFNGEIYNFQELRDELAASGYPFNSRTDTEVLLALYQRDGEKMLDRINGMFAFAIWDKKRQTLFLARDRLGKKPLYYFHYNGFFIFASEIKAILQIAEVSRELRPDAIRDFFAYQYIPDPKTIFRHIHKLNPGHSLTTSSQQFHINQYWDLSFSRTIDGPKKTIATTLLNNIENCVKSRMVSDVPLGAFLSGGVDSSGVVGLMARNSQQPVTTCSIGFDSEKFDEVKYAAQIAQQFGTNHHEFTVKDNVEDNLEQIAAYFDEPFADPSLVPTFFVSRLARQAVTVALAGDGGDENFAGYSKYVIDEVENNLRKRIPIPVRKHLLPQLAKMFRLSNHGIARKAATLLTALSHDPAYGFYLTNSFFKESLWDSVASPEFKRTLGDYHPASVTLDHYNKADGPDHLARVLYTDIKTYLPGDILVKVDRMSMANSLEVRAPLLDYTVMEYAAMIPSSLKLHNGDKKHILKQAFSQLLTHDTLYRKKMGFSVPLAEWLRNQLREKSERILFQTKTGLPEYFKMDAVRTIWNEHQRGTHDHSSELWSMLMFQLWHNRYAHAGT